MRGRYAVLAVSLAVLVAFSSGCRQLKARDNLNKGVQAFKAVPSTPTRLNTSRRRWISIRSSPTARLYLATAYEMQYVPGSMRRTICSSPPRPWISSTRCWRTNRTTSCATSSIASLYYNEKKFDEAEQWNRKVIAIDPKNKEAYYTLGVLAWTNWLPVDRQARIDSKQKGGRSGPDQRR